MVGLIRAKVRVMFECGQLYCKKRFIMKTGLFCTLVVAVYYYGWMGLIRVKLRGMFECGQLWVGRWVMCEASRR